MFGPQKGSDVGCLRNTPLKRRRLDSVGNNEDERLLGIRFVVFHLHSNDVGAVGALLGELSTLDPVHRACHLATENSTPIDKPRNLIRLRLGAHIRRHSPQRCVEFDPHVPLVKDAFGTQSLSVSPGP